MTKLIKKNWIIICILILAAFLRLYRIDGYMEFLGDQGRDMVIVRDFLKNGNLFFIGPQTSVGNMYLGPFYYYLISPSLLLANFNPIGPAIFVALVGILTVWFVYFVVKSWFKSERAALISAFLYAISPVVIKYSNFSWNPNVMPFFALLFIYSIEKAVFQNKYKYFLLASLAFILALNSHFLALILLPVAGVFWLIHLIGLIRSKNKKLKSFLINTFLAFLIFFVSLTPQILFDIKHQGQNINAFLDFFRYRETTVNIKPYKAIPAIVPLFNQINTRLLAGKNELFGVFVSVFLFVGILFVFYILKQQKNQKQLIHFSLLVVWYLFGLIGLGLYKQHIYDHYFGFLFPVVLMLMGIIIDQLLIFEFFKKGRFLIYLFLICLIFFSFLENPFRYSPSNQLSTTKIIVDSIIKESNQQPFNFALLAKQNYDPTYKYFLTEKKAELVDTHNKVADQLFVVCEPFQIDCNPINNPEWAVASFGWAKIQSEWEINGIKIFKLIHNK